MRLHEARHFHIWYNGTPEQKLAQARALLDRLGPELRSDSGFFREIRQLQGLCQDLATHMQAMELGRLCSSCAARPDGGCCSAVMADNTDSLQLLINLLLGTEIHAREHSDTDCCFLGPTGCPFPAKPIFCLNYNCTHILGNVDPAQLAVLDKRTAAVLGQQTRIEGLLLDRLRTMSL